MSYFSIVAQLPASGLAELSVPKSVAY